ncbi:MAG: electron transfer flavoprotein subunit alpha/FixB family protein [Coriobacteriia bacterium]|nr:electron transfer flavoprotein subunit alpha/FixB family protein [Coriobacteriia bacterium]
MLGVLVWSDQTKLACELLSAAREIDQEVFALAINDDAQAESLAQKGAQVFRLNNQSLEIANTASIAHAISQVVNQLNPEYILLSSNRRGKELAGRLAQIINAGCLSDVRALVSSDGQIECVRNALGGATIAHQVIKTQQKLIAISANCYEVPSDQGGGQVQDISVKVEDSKLRLLSTQGKPSEGVEISSAEVVVAVGQGLENEELLETVNKIANQIGGIVGCTKPIATDRKWLGEERIIGLSGATCKPNVALLLGTSGQVQFSVGIRDADTIVAVDKDDQANVFTLADYYLVADLNDFLPKLSTSL